MRSLIESELRDPPKLWHSKLWSGVPRDSDPRMTVLARTSINLPSRPRSVVPSSLTTQSESGNRKIWSWVPWDAELRMCWRRPTAIYPKQEPRSSVVCLHYYCYSFTHGAEPFPRSCQLCSHSRTSQHFMEPEGSLTCSQEPSTPPYSEPDQTNPSRPILSLSDPF
jgi:hypothetical protein